MGFLDIYETGYTTYNCALLAICPFLPEETRKAIYPVITCTSWGIFTSFHSSIFMETAIFEKLASRYNVNKTLFNLGNFITHLVPAATVSWLQPQSIQNYHGVISSCMQYSWILLVTKGTYLLDRVYVPCKKNSWYKMISISLLTQLATPLIYNLWSSKKKRVKFI
tara:strand:- start:4820 stop:5317 length:498 start_codon:yes stop_codon:yes gene_type:complete